MMLGVHCSVSGGLQHAFEEAAELGIDVFQVFTRNQRQWKAKPVSEEEQNLFHTAWKAHPGVKVIFSHSSYLINVASADSRLQKTSIEALRDEVLHCHALGLSFTVLHPGAAGEHTEEEAMGRIIGALKEVIAQTSGSKVKILLENTAGQGSHVGYKFEHLNYIMNGVGSDRIATCFDTCHAFASGYDLRTTEAFDDTMSRFDKIVGLRHILAAHLNDSKGDLGSRIDRHEHIGKGKIGVHGFKLMMHKFAHIPKVLETKKEDDMDKENLKILRGFK
jgi:deoxyribonuclease-4